MLDTGAYYQNLHFLLDASASRHVGFRQTSREMCLSANAPARRGKLRAGFSRPQSASNTKKFRPSDASGAC